MPTISPEFSRSLSLRSYWQLGASSYVVQANLLNLRNVVGTGCFPASKLNLPLVCVQPLQLLAVAQGSEDVCACQGVHASCVSAGRVQSWHHGWHRSHRWQHTHCNAQRFTPGHSTEHTDVCESFLHMCHDMHLCEDECRVSAVKEDSLPQADIAVHSQLPTTKPCVAIDSDL